MRDFIVFDSSKFPIVIGKYQSFIPTWEETAKCFSDMEDFISTHTDFVLILDFSEISASLPSEYRVKANHWAAKSDPLFVRHRIKFVFYTPSTVIKIIMKGSLFVSPISCPYIIVSNLDKAYSWASKQLKGSPNTGSV